MTKEEFNKLLITNYDLILENLHKYHQLDDKSKKITVLSSIFLLQFATKVDIIKNVVSDEAFDEIDSIIYAHQVEDMQTLAVLHNSLRGISITIRLSSGKHMLLIPVRTNNLLNDLELINEEDLGNIINNNIYINNEKELSTVKSNIYSLLKDLFKVKRRVKKVGGNNV